MAGDLPADAAAARARAEHPFGREHWDGHWDDTAAHVRSSAGFRLWMPVLLSLVTQVPAALVRWRLADASTEPVVLWLGLGIALVGPLALIGARRFPGPVVAVSAAAASVDLLVTSEIGGPPYVALAFAIVGAIVRAARIWAWVSVGVAWVATLGIAASLGLTWQPLRIAAITLGILVVMGVGEGIRSRKERFDTLGRELAERRRSEVQAERVRIARELHDVLAHSLSQINVQAGVGLHLAEKHPDKAAAALASIKEASKTALDEVRSVLGVLRAEGATAPGAPLVPEPDLARLPSLVASFSAQGITVTLDNALAAPPPAAVQLALFRIAQEALTNVSRHSAAHSASVTIRQTATSYNIDVRDDGHGAATASHTGAGGRGLLGMRERAELLGGTLVTRSPPGGGFTVTASIPVPRTIDHS